MIEPLLSVVVPSYNSEKYVEETLNSLGESQHPEVEFIFMDGGSADGTMRIVEKYKHLFAKIVSEPDNGQSDAFNKGFALAKGQYLTWLNSDDVFCYGALKKTVEWIKKERLPWYAANVVYIDSESRIARCCQSGDFEGWALRFGILNVFGPATIFSRKIFEKYGPLREDFHYCMDTEYWWRLASSGERFLRVPTYLWALRLHQAAKTSGAISSEFGQLSSRHIEEQDIIRNLYHDATSRTQASLGKSLARAFRCMNGSYLRSLRDTKRFKGALISKLI